METNTGTGSKRKVKNIAPSTVGESRSISKSLNRANPRAQLYIRTMTPSHADWLTFTQPKSCRRQDVGQHRTSCTMRRAPKCALSSQRVDATLPGRSWPRGGAMILQAMAASRTPFLNDKNSILACIRPCSQIADQNILVSPSGEVFARSGSMSLYTSYPTEAHVVLRTEVLCYTLANISPSLAPLARLALSLALSPSTPR